MTELFKNVLLLLLEGVFFKFHKRQNSDYPRSNSVMMTMMILILTLIWF